MVKQKITDFVKHLLSNPNLKGESLLIAEGLILNFIAENLATLGKTFQAPEFFPEQSARETLNMIFTELKDHVCSNMLPPILEHIDKIDFSVLHKFDHASTFNDDQYKEYFKKFVTEIFSNKDVRYNFESVSNIFNNNIVEKYLSEIFKRRSAMYIELVRVQQNSLELSDYINYLKILLLIKNSAYIRIAIDPENKTNLVNINDFKNVPKNLAMYFDGAARIFQNKLPGVSPGIIKMALKSNLKNNTIKSEDASAKFIDIFHNRYINYKDYGKLDRGAESPDKSWFAIVRQNIKKYPYDKRMIDDLYFIAGDNNW